MQQNEFLSIPFCSGVICGSSLPSQTATAPLLQVKHWTGLAQSLLLHVSCVVTGHLSVQDVHMDGKCGLIVVYKSNLLCFKLCFTWTCKLSCFLICGPQRWVSKRMRFLFLSLAPQDANLMLQSVQLDPSRNSMIVDAIGYQWRYGV